MKKAFTPFDNTTRYQKPLDWSLSAGEGVYLLREKGAWSEIEAMNKCTGWVPTNKIVKML